MFLRPSLSLCGVTNCWLRAATCSIDHVDRQHNMQQNMRNTCFCTTSFSSESPSGWGTASFADISEIKNFLFLSLLNPMTKHRRFDTR